MHSLWEYGICGHVTAVLSSVSQAGHALTCQSVIHVETKALDLLHGQAAVDKHPAGGLRGRGGVGIGGGAAGHTVHTGNTDTAHCRE